MSVERNAKKVKESAPVTKEEYQRVMKEFEDGIKTPVWDMGERIALGLMKANRVLAAYRTNELTDQYKEIDMMWDWHEDGEDYRTAYEIKTDCAAFCRKSEKKYLNRAVQYVEPYTGRVLDKTLGTGNVFIELVQNMPKCLWYKVRDNKPLSDEELNNINEILRKEPGMEKKFAKGWMQIIRENRLETTPGRYGRFVWFVLPMPYIVGRRILIITIPDQELIRIEEKKKQNGSIRYTYAIEKDRNGKAKMSWGWLLPLSELFQFAVKDVKQTDPYARTEFYFNLGRVERFKGKLVTGLGARSSNGSNAVAFLWDVDKGKDGYTTWEKSGYVPPAECSRKAKYDNFGDFLLAEIKDGNVETAAKGDLTPMVPEDQ